MDKAPKTEDLSVNFSFALLSLLNFLTLEALLIGCPEISVQNLHSMLRNILEQISHDDLVMQDLVWLKAVQFGAVRFGTSSMNSI